MYTTIVSRNVVKKDLSFTVAVRFERSSQFVFFFWVFTRASIVLRYHWSLKKLLYFDFCFKMCV
jgi:hypothetical protein